MAINDSVESYDHEPLDEYPVMVKRFHSALTHRLGRNLALYRKRAGLTQEQLAEVLQIEVSTVSRYETGSALPSLVTLSSIAAQLRVTAADLLMEEAPSLSEDEARFLSMLQPLSPDERQAALEVLSALVVFLRKQPGREVEMARAEFSRLPRRGHGTGRSTAQADEAPFRSSGDPIP